MIALVRACSTSGNKVSIYIYPSIEFIRGGGVGGWIHAKKQIWPNSLMGLFACQGSTQDFTLHSCKDLYTNEVATSNMLFIYSGLQK